MSPARLAKRRFSTAIQARGVTFEVVRPDGTHVFGEAEWKLDLAYVRR